MSVPLWLIFDLLALRIVIHTDSEKDEDRESHPVAVSFHPRTTDLWKIRNERLTGGVFNESQQRSEHADQGASRDETGCDQRSFFLPRLVQLFIFGRTHEQP